MALLFNRQAIVQMGTILVSGLRTSFKIEKQETSVPSSATVTVWNLAKSTRQTLLSQGSVPVVLGAGYGATSPILPVLFKGDIVQYGIAVERSGTDWLTTFKLGDGLLSHQTDRVSISVPKGQTVLQALQQLLGQFKGTTAAQALASLPTLNLNAVLGNGTAISGRAIDETKKMLAPFGYGVKYVDGQIEIVPFSTTLATNPYAQEQAPNLTPTTGLLGSPIPTQQGFIKFKCYLRPEIKPDRYVQLTWSAHPEGMWVQAKKITHTGDTRGPEWFTEVEGVAK